MLMSTPQVRQRHSQTQQVSFARCGTLDSSLPRPAYHRPCPLSIQWLPLWNPHSFHILRKEPVDLTSERDLVCRPSLSKAHFPVSGPGLLCLHSKCLLPGTKVDFPDSVCQLLKARCLASSGFRECIRSFHLLTANPAAIVTIVPILTRLVSCLLGT